MKNNIIKTVFIMTSVFSAQTIASSEDNIVAEVQSCAQVTDNLLRLTCFDKLVVKLSKTASVEQIKSPVAKTSDASSVKVATASVASVPQIQKEAEVTKKQVDDFAKQHIEKTDGIEEITASITKLKKLLRGEYQITLDNDQLWQQKGSARISLKVGQQVVLSKGMLGAVYLTKEGNSKRIQVRRIK